MVIAVVAFFVTVSLLLLELCFALGIAAEMLFFFWEC